MPADKDKIFHVEAQEDFVEKLTVASNAGALSELIWNGLDAEATKVSVEVDYSSLGLARIRVSDDGHGIAPEEAESLFMHLGGSWKRNNKKSKNGIRVLHGEEGKGRFRALALGRVAEWLVTARNAAGQLVRYKITVIKDSAREFRIGPVTVLKDDLKTGVEVTVSEPYKQWKLDTPNIIQELNETHALYLREYPNVKITFLGTTLDPKKIIEFEQVFALPPISDGAQKSHEVQLEVVEWKTETERMLYLCSEDAFPLHRIAPGIHAAGFDFSAYLRSTYISQLAEQGTLELVNLEPRLNESVENAKDQLREHFKTRTKEKLQNLVDQWKSEEVYPYKEEPKTPIQKVERQTFDVVAVNVATTLPEFQAQDQKYRRFQLRMLRQAVERSPEELQLILEEVLGLSQQKQEELAKLLKQTTLASIISASSLVADRLNFLTGLETMLFDPELKKEFKERSQLHRILADNTWVFGEEFALTVDDQSLTEVLKKHLKLAKRKDIIVNKPVKRIDGKTGIVDLMLSKKVPTNREDELSHLVVELKAPTVIATSKETEQIEQYAFAVQEDERFRNIPTRWSFWLVVNGMDKLVTKKVRQREKPDGLLYDSGDPNVHSRIWVKTWSQIIHDCKTRLRIFQDALNLTADKGVGLEYLKKTYQRVLLGVDIGPDVEEEEVVTEAAHVPAKIAAKTPAKK